MNSELEAALAALGGPSDGWSGLNLPARPGLYAVYGSNTDWQDLQLANPDVERPLYVGKSESSLVARDLNTHFADGRTGSSTLRRSLAALLAISIDLEARPRNPLKPERFANYGLRPQDEPKLSEWMRSKLRLSVWVPNEPSVLVVVERRVLDALLPPLNIKDVVTPWKDQVTSARARMAKQAKAWAASNKAASA